MKIMNFLCTTCVLCTLLCVPNIEMGLVFRQSIDNTCSENCISIPECPILNNYLLTRSKEPEVLKLLRSSHCGYEKKIPKVCCPVNETSILTAPVLTEDRITQTADKLNDVLCGKSDIKVRDKIVGGQNSSLGSWPWMAAIGYTTSKRGPDFRCGGTLITSKHVITAAHCVSNTGSQQPYMVRLGDLNLDDDVEDNATPTDIPISGIIAHPDYKRIPITNDIAILTLKESVSFTRLIRPLCLPLTPELRSDTFSKYFPYIIGWGATEYRGPVTNALMETQIPAFKNDACKKSFEKEPGALIDDRVICAGGNGKDACQGDSGGPLMIPHTSTRSYYLIGIVSFGKRCAEPGYPGVYTRVTAFVDWIQRNTE